jgi:anti-anti-sigma regulatory factor
MLRITVIPAASSERLKLEGRLAGDAVEELRRLCEERLAGTGSRRVILDLAAVSFIDNDGIELFRTLCRHNVIVCGHSPFVAELLKEVLPCS